jgi:threonine/homoserine/homoserine lactone efflux protein
MAIYEGSVLSALILRGFILGLAIAAPVGPIGVLCIRRTLAQGRLFGFVSGLGAATADAIYGCIAALGLTAISALLVRQQDLLRLLGGLFLCYLGVKTLLARPADRSAAPEGQGLGRACFSTLLLTLTNPITILSFVAVFAGLGVGRASNGYSAAAAIVLGVFLGSAAWWFLLSGGVSLVRDKFDARAMLWVNRISGTIILGFGLVALAGPARTLWR